MWPPQYKNNLDCTFVVFYSLAYEYVDIENVGTLNSLKKKYFQYAQTEINLKLTKLSHN